MKERWNKATDLDIHPSDSLMVWGSFLIRQSQIMVILPLNERENQKIR